MLVPERTDLVDRIERRKSRVRYAPTSTPNPLYDSRQPVISSQREIERAVLQLGNRPELPDGDGWRRTTTCGALCLSFGSGTSGQ